jgi:hypothetical protein
MPNRLSMNRLFLAWRSPSPRLDFFNKRIIPLKIKIFYRPEGRHLQGEKNISLMG